MLGKTALPLVVSILLAIVLYQLHLAYNVNDHHIVYPIDDTYIHMAMAKNLATHGVWGVTPYEFSSTSSSILFTSLIALTYKIFGVNEYSPLAINIVVAVLLLTVLYLIFKKEGVKPLGFVVLSLFIIVVTPLPALIISGMEHVLQFVLDLSLIYLSAKALEKPAVSRKEFLVLCALSVLCVLIRFEGVFIVGIIGGLFIIKRQFKQGIALLLFGALPIIILGIVSIRNGSYFVPNSILLKGERPQFSLRGLVLYCFVWINKVSNFPHLLIPFLGLIAYFIYLRTKDLSFWLRQNIYTLIVIGVFVLHLNFSKTGWFFRYEAYLVLLSVIPAIWIFKDVDFRLNWRKDLLKYAAVLLLIAVGLFPMVLRGTRAYKNTVISTHNIYEQQYQMARFVQKYYPNGEICANDIGAITYFNDVKLFDIFGLASKEVLTARLKHQFNKDTIHKLSLAKNTKVVIIYDDWFPDKIPEQWQKAGEWKVSDNYILGGEIVSFYATENYNVQELMKNLQDFSRTLPVYVTQQGAYVQK